MYRHLMDNAIASKQRLNLSVGISLSAEQVAALTHDIVWLEEYVVNGEKVLVPVLYLAQANNRLGPNGALIQGENLSLITGGDLNSVGTLRASNDFSAVAGGSIGNGGLIEAGNRLDMLAADSIRNDQGGIIGGRDLSFTALTGDVLNERTVTHHESASGSRRYIQDVADSAARIEAANSLSFSAGRDMANIGGVLDSGGDIDIDAGRDVAIVSAEERLVDEYGRKNRNSRTLQHAAEVNSGRDVQIVASRDFTARDGRIDAYENITVGAGRDMTLASAANEEHFYSKTKRGSTKITRQEDQVRQQATEVNANGDVMLSANNSMVLSASRIDAGGEAYLVAGGQMALLAAEDLDYSLYDMKKKGSWGSSKTQRDEITKITNVGSEITTGGDLTLLSGDDQTYQRARLESGEDLTLESGGEIAFEGVKDLKQESHEKSDSGFVWTSAKGKGNTDETLRQSVLLAQGEVVIKAVDGLKIDIKQVNQQTVTQTIDAMVQADPQLAWLKEAELRGDVDWRRVKEIHESFKYEHSGLGGGAAIIIAIVMSVITAGAGAALVGAVQGTWQAAIANTVFTSVATQTTVSTINNRGNLGAVFKDVTSSDALKSYAVAGITAGLTSGVYDNVLKTNTNPITGKVTVDLNSAEGVSRFAANQTLQNVTAAAVGKALGQETSLGGALQSALLNTLAATSFNAAGNLGLQNGSPQKIALHALVGGLLAEAAGSDFAIGAVAAGANEALADQLRQAVTQMSPENRDMLLTMSSQLVGVVAAAVVDGSTDADKLQTGAWVANNATQYNFLNHDETADFVESINECGSDTNCQRNVWTGENFDFDRISQDNLKEALDTMGPVWAKDQLTQIEGGLHALAELNCTTALCEDYKFTLIDRGIKAAESLTSTVEKGGIVIGAVAGMAGAGTRSGNTPVASNANKAYEYWAKVRTERAGAKGSATGKAALPAGYREGSSAGAGFAETAGLPDGYRRVINTKTGNTEVLAADGKLYLETVGGLKPKAGGNLAGLVSAEKQIASAKEPTRFIDGVKVVDQKTGQVFQGTVDLGPTLDRIKSGGSFPHRNDGSIFQNRAGDLPKKPAGYYTEYVHPTPSVSGPGPQRIVVGKGGEMYYTADHYKTFVPIKN